MSFDSVEAIRAFAEKCELPFLLLSDADGAISVAYGAAQAQSDGYARRISYLIGPDGTIAHVWGKVDVKAHAADVLAAIG